MVAILELLFVAAIALMEGIALIDQLKTSKLQQAYWKERRDYFARRLLRPVALPKGISPAAKKDSSQDTPESQSESSKSPEAVRSPELNPSGESRPVDQP